MGEERKGTKLQSCSGLFSNCISVAVDFFLNSKMGYIYSFSSYLWIIEKKGFALLCITNGTDRLLEICKSENLSEFVRKQQTKFAAHIIRQPNSSQTKQLLFNDDYNHKKSHKVPNLIDQAVKNTGLSGMDQFARESKGRKF